MAITKILLKSVQKMFTSNLHNILRLLRLVASHEKSTLVDGSHYLVTFGKNWADDKQSKARNSDGKYRQMALVGFDT